MIQNQLIIDFLRDLVANNNRDWFAANKERYQTTLDAFREEVAWFIARIGEFDERVKYLTPEECLFRIYRDIRFSPNKLPYKNHFGAYICPNGGRKSLLSGYYLHLQPDGSFLSGGIYCPQPAALKQLRESIELNYHELAAIANEKPFKKAFDGIVSPEVLKRVPTGFSPDSPAAEWLKYKHFIVEHPLTEAELVAADFREKALDVFRAMKPFNDFCNESLER